MRIIILGNTSSGKTTQSRFISKLLKIKRIELGHLLRKESKRNNSIKKLMLKGQLIPDKVVINILNKEIKDKDDFILDGFPRTLKQLKSLNFIPDIVLFLKINRENIIKRALKRKRFDDTKKAIGNRYKIYLKKTTPVVNYYKKLKLLNEINGNPPIKKVNNYIKKILIKYQQQP